MKRLTIRYGDQVLFDADVAGIAWDDRNGIKVEAGQRSSGGLADLLTGLSKQKTADTAAEKRTTYQQERST